MSMLRSGVKASAKKIGTKAVARRGDLAKAYKFKPKRSLGQKIKSGVKNAVKGIPRGLGIGLAGYGAYSLGKDIAGKFKGKKTATTTTKKDTGYIPQSQMTDAQYQDMLKKKSKRKKMYGGKMKKYAKGGAKPDYIDLDGDGNTTEPMKSTYGHGGPYYNRGRRIPGMYNGM